MIYDKFCKITERKIIESHKEDYDMLSNLKLFWFEQNAHDLTNSINDESIYLPFKTTGIEDNATLIIIFDTIKDQIGSGGRRDFIEVMSSHTVGEGFNDGGKFDDLKRMALEVDEILTIIRGTIVSINNRGDSWTCNGYVSKLDVINFNQLEKMDINYESEYDNYVKYSLQNAMAAIQEIAYLNYSNHFILEDAPIKSRKIKKGKLLRAHERSKYILLKPNQIRKKLGLREIGDGDKRRSPTPHDRRAHKRIIHRGTDKERVIRVRASWIGPNKATIGKRIYKVLLDR